MQYEQLFNVVMDKGTVVFRVSDYPSLIAMPISGYAVALQVDEILSTPLNDDPRVVGERWDFIVKVALDTAPLAGVEYVMCWNDGERLNAVPVHVFSKREYAMGYAHGSGMWFIFDLYTNKQITRKR